LRPRAGTLQFRSFDSAQDRILLVKLREFHFSSADFGYKMNWEITNKDYKFKTEEED
jgi:hypothetical protein